MNSTFSAVYKSTFLTKSQKLERNHKLFIKDTFYKLHNFLFSFGIYVFHLTSWGLFSEMYASDIRYPNLFIFFTDIPIFFVLFTNIVIYFFYIDILIFDTLPPHPRGGIYWELNMKLICTDHLFWFAH